jgi:peroxiredoxin
VLARVNGENITNEQVDRELLLNRALTALANDGKEVSTTRSAILEDLISRRMQAQDAGRAGLSLTDAQVDEWIMTYFQGRQWTKAQVMEALTGYGLTWEDMRDGFRDTALINTYLIKYVSRGAKTADEAVARQNDWLSNLESTSQVTRFRNPDEGQALRVGSPAPDFTAQSLDGKTLKLSDLRGRPVLVNFWATWCQPCRIEIPTLVNTYQQLRAAGKDLEIVALAVNSAPDTVTAFRNEFKMPFMVAPDSGSQISTIYYVGAIPTSYLIDREGIVRWIHVNMMDDKLLAQQLAALP